MNEHRPWINFKELRARLDFEDVLRHYRVEVSRKGDQHLGPCPLPGHPKEKRGNTFSANIPRGIFQCFACKAKGNVLDFAGLMAGVDIADGAELRKVAVELQRTFFPDGASRRTRPAPATDAAPPDAAVNAPLDFELKGLDEGHACFEGLRLSPETVAHFGLGFCARGLLKGRVAIPLHDPEGKRVGYAGLAAEAVEPRYLFPEDRERRGAKLCFRKGLLLYNAHRVEGPCEDLVVVEEIESVWWVHQCGFAPVVSTLGASCSEDQARLLASLLSPTGRLWVMPSGTDEGACFADAVVARMVSHRFVRRIGLGLDRKPTDFSKEEIRRCFA